jgi:hypothetical protein
MRPTTGSPDNAPRRAGLGRTTLAKRLATLAVVAIPLCLPLASGATAAQPRGNGKARDAQTRCAPRHKQRQGGNRQKRRPACGEPKIIEVPLRESRLTPPPTRPEVRYLPPEPTPELPQEVETTYPVETEVAEETEVTEEGEAGPESEEEGSAAQETGEETHFRFFAPSSVWNRPLPPDEPLDPLSAAIVARLNAEVGTEQLTERGPSINTSKWSTPVYEVPEDQPTVRVEKANGPAAALQAAWSAVPLPPDAKPAAGTDRHLVVWQPSSDRLWEFWRLEKGAEGWRAPWGGAMKDVSSNPGVYGPEAWPGATRGWGGTASSFSLAGGLITLEDLEAGHIDHALALGVPDVRAGFFALPASRCDGTSLDPLALPEGAHLRLDPDLDLSSMRMPRVTRMIAEAAQRYGIVVRSRAGNVDFYGQDPSSTGSDPYAGPNGYFEGRPRHRLLGSFPWSHLQLLQMTILPDL